MTANVICYRGKSAIREVGKAFGFDEEMLGPAFEDQFSLRDLQRRRAQPTS
jgi:hypothetical protein